MPHQNGKTALGICVGASTIKLVSISSGENPQIIHKETVSHECNITAAMDSIFKRYPLINYDYACVTGRKFKDIINIPSITEPRAVELALEFSGGGNKPVDAVVSLGSESFILYQTNTDGAVIGVKTGNKCASGTGEFFLQQIRRMGLSAEEAAGIAMKAEPYRVSGRCSVFCKSDCTHALNKGVPRENVTSGLADMIAEKVADLFGALPSERVMLVGGMTKNTVVISRIRGRLPHLIIPDTADCFEALGAALYALQEKISLPEKIVIGSPASSFSTLPPIASAEKLVTFQSSHKEKAAAGDETVLGLDVGSTTTKAALVRTRDNAVLASIYLRTNGNPIEASRNCYNAILMELNGVPVKITGLGVTGSGRHIAGLHAGTDAIINEIIAHATGAAFYDKDVDTILEIGGQDAKYTYLVNGVPCDYAMNEACSAGTGSFLEEAAQETLGIDVLDIEKIALRGGAPPNFNDQCAAFIGSDIRNASHEISRDNIVAGLVHSICMNYNNRVRGPRKIGTKIFMQGGVCYNKAVPMAMASLLGRGIIVPPDPGLMGAFGVALETYNRIQMGLLEKTEFDLSDLACRTVEYGKTFICHGAMEHCDKKCSIATIGISGKLFPFGGICNKYYNQVHNIKIDPVPYDFVDRRQENLYADRSLPAMPNGKRVGIPASFYVNTLFPLYHDFFTTLGFTVVLSDEILHEGIQRSNSAFCFPALLAHGMLADLIKKGCDWYFLPEIKELSVEKSYSKSIGHQSSCITIQGEPYYMATAFREIRKKFLSPVLSWHLGWDSMKDQFAQMAISMGSSREAAESAYDSAVAKLEAFFELNNAMGKEALDAIEKDPEAIGVIIFGRSYNAFSADANMGIPRKFASRKIYCIPFDSLPFYDENSQENMTWASGQDILRGARFVEKHPRLFGAFITNFSCGPDSFLVTYFRDIMGMKPSLTIEIDNHTADAGINTRIEAFLDIIARYRAIGIQKEKKSSFVRADLVTKNGNSFFKTSGGEIVSVKDKRVKVLFPSMGRTTSLASSAVFESFGIRSEVVPMPSMRTLKLGRANTSCKECLPLTITIGGLLEYIEDRIDKNEYLLYFMPTAHGNCRFGQYYVFTNRLIDAYQYENVATLTLSTENNYCGLGALATIRIMKGLFIGDMMDDVRNAIIALAVDRKSALKLYDVEFAKILDELRRGGRHIYRVLRKTAKALSTIKLKTTIGKSKRVVMAGEIFVRRDELSSQAVVEALAARDIVVLRAPVMEWIRFVDARIRYDEKKKFSLRHSLEILTRRTLVNTIEKKMKRILEKSGLFHYEMINMNEVLETAGNFINRWFHGEVVLVIGRFFNDILKDFHGLISIGPFACLPTRVTESILTPESHTAGNDRIDALHNSMRLQSAVNLPFLSIESDGNQFPQIIDAQIEAFILQVERVHKQNL